MGAVNTLVIASADAALELFKSHDQAFINRHPIQALQPSNEDNHGTPWDVMDLESATGNELYQLLEKIGVLSTMPNIADFFPWLRNLDPQNLANRTMNAVNACADIVDGFAKERRITDAIRNNKEEKDYWDLLIDFEGNGKDEPRKLSDRHINWFITEIFIGGTDSLINSIEWVMSEVVRNPEVMRKAKDEIGQVVGYHRKIDESD
ncbi:cytochrome P450 76A2-like [Papaver somniferum]|uniref:cytochrome P450 76A2-like n=1 Tax=Papaver somniferum TaxID=3469 RepID=UPI000E6FD36C|nr:cytochrome P450 76A2-like [Papaver somniferum]